MRQIIVIGGGTAGMIVAATAGATSTRVTLFEKNGKLGKKIYITGKGRCNLTSAAPMREVQTQVVNNPRFLYSTLQAPTNGGTVRFSESAGCPFKVERSDRAFPVSDRASGVIHVLERRVQATGVCVSPHVEVCELLLAGEGETYAVTGVVLTDSERLSADAVILATGGTSYPATGSTDDGYRFAEAASVAVTERYSFLVPLTLKEQESYTTMQGLSLKNITITLKDGKKKVCKSSGETLFTHLGMSGPLLLSASALVGPLLRTKKGLELQVNLKPALTEERPEQRLLREFDASKDKGLKNILPSLLPQSLISEVLWQSGISGEKKARDITKTEWVAPRQAAKSLRFMVTGLRGHSEAVVTEGGVSVCSLSSATLESRAVKELYFAGEFLDLDVMTGGFSLQITWPTGMLIGKSATEPK